MKVAFLFSGQVRDIPSDLFRLSLLNLTKDLEYDIYSFFWEETGKSLNHANLTPEVSKSKNATALAKRYFQGFNLKEAKYESYRNYELNLPTIYKEINLSKDFHRGTLNCMPQIYCLSNCFNLISGDIGKYDLIFKCRFDTLFLHPLSLYNLESILMSNKIYTINFGRAYYPARIYDIFFGGSVSSMIFLKDIWKKFPSLVYDEFNNRLDKRDACRVFFLAAKNKGISSSSFETRICDVYRNFKNNHYEKYLLSMHLISLRSIHKFERFFPHYLKWFKYRNFNSFFIIFFTIKSLLVLPFSYLKRLKFNKYVHSKLIIKI